MKTSRFFSMACMVFLSTFIACGDDEEPDQTTNPPDQTTCTLGPELCACEVLTQPDVQSGAVLAEDTCYRVESPLFVQDGEILAEPGVTVYFSQNAGLAISGNGSISVEGSQEKPVLFTSVATAPAQGDWGGLEIGSNLSTNKIDHAIFEYGGSGRSMITIGGTAAVSNTLLRASTHAMTVGDGAKLTGFTGNTFENNEHVLSLPLAATEKLDPDTAFVENTDTFIEVTDATISSALKTPALDLPYRITRKVAVNKPWSIDKGCTFEFNEGMEVLVSGEGSLSALGEADAPITFRGVDSQRGFWKGISVTTNQTANAFDFVTLEDAGSAAWLGGGTGQGGIFLRNGKLKITNSTLRRNKGAALWAYDGSNIDGFEKNTFENNQTPMWIAAQNVHSLSGTSTFNGNDEQSVRVVFGNNEALTQPQTWKAMAVPYHIADRFYVNNALTIEEGTTLKFSEIAEIRVTDEGSLKAVGTADKRITFTGASETRGFWPGIQIETNQIGNRLEYVDISYGGKPRSWGEGSVFITDNGLLSVDNIKISFSGEHGIVLDDNGSLTCGMATFENNNGADVWQRGPNGFVVDACNH